MPWKVASHPDCPAGKPHAVVKKDGGALVACHASRKGATQQLKALYANEGKK